MTEPTTEAPATDSEATAETEQPKPTETVDFWKQKAREQEKRAKENATAAQRLAEIEEANKTESQKTAERLAAAEKDAAEARREALRLRIASRFSIPDDDADLFLTGSDEDTLTRQAERLTAREADKRKQGNHVPREGSTPTAAESSDREAVRAIFGGPT